MAAVARNIPLQQPAEHGGSMLLEGNRNGFISDRVPNSRLAASQICQNGCGSASHGDLRPPSTSAAPIHSVSDTGTLSSEDCSISGEGEGFPEGAVCARPRLSHQHPRDGISHGVGYPLHRLSPEDARINLQHLHPQDRKGKDYGEHTPWTNRPRGDGAVGSFYEPRDARGILMPCASWTRPEPAPLEALLEDQGKPGQKGNCLPTARSYEAIRTGLRCCVSHPASPLEKDPIWASMKHQAKLDAESEPVLASYLQSTIISHASLENSLAAHLANKLASPTLLSTHLMLLFRDIFPRNRNLGAAVRRDLEAVKERDPACDSYLHCFLNFKGFCALQVHRVAHELWQSGRNSLALALSSRASEVFQVDIHPGAQFGSGIVLDHGTGVVVGETAVVGNDVTMLHNVTLGGSGVGNGQRHPIVEDCVLFGAGSKVLGRVRIGAGAKIGACSVVIQDVSAGATVVGNPGKEIKKAMP